MQARALVRWLTMLEINYWWISGVEQSTGSTLERNNLIDVPEMRPLLWISRVKVNHVINRNRRFARQFFNFDHWHDQNSWLSPIPWNLRTPLEEVATGCQMNGLFGFTRTTTITPKSFTVPRRRTRTRWHRGKIYLRSVNIPQPYKLSVANKISVHCVQLA